ncbi:MAG: hypothetical protein HC769_29120 [Cyanobacteria bacterium CRU_2_1]|nr:hypothetical protein [Cyanobacteria bacterium CRU_2_1]
MTNSTCKISVDEWRGVGAIPVWLPWFRGQSRRGCSGLEVDPCVVALV